jgi:hypothetical protein
VEAWIDELRPYPGEGRWGAGWRLAKSAWRLVRSDPTLRGLALAQGLLFAVVISGQLGIDDFRLGFSGGNVGLQLLCHALAAFGTTFLMFALARAADARIDGLPMGIGEALAEAREEPAAILGWGLIALAVSAATWLLGEQIGFVSILLAFAWYLLSAFAIPAMAFEGLAPGAALAESLRTFRWRGRNALAGLLGLAIFAALAALVPGFMFEHAAATHTSGGGTDYPLLVAAFVLLALIYSAALSSREAFALILLREDLEDLPGRIYSGPRPRRRTKVLRFAGTCLAVLALLVAASAVTEEDRRINDANDAPGATYETVVTNPAGVELENGDAVYYRQQEIGTVLGSEPEGTNLRINFHVDPGYGPTETPGSFVVVGNVGARGLCPCLILVPTGGGSPNLQIS